MERRKATRVRCETPCTIAAGKKPSPAVVRNASASGLGIDAPLDLAAVGDEVEITLQPPGRPPIDLVAMVWHARVVRRAAGGDRFAQLGVVLSEANDDYLRWIESLLPPAAASRPVDERSVAPPARLRFAVQVAHADSSRTRRVLVFAADADEARALAADAAGAGWCVVSLQPARS